MILKHVNMNVVQTEFAHKSQEIVSVIKVMQDLIVPKEYVLTIAMEMDSVIMENVTVDQDLKVKNT